MKNIILVLVSFTLLFCKKKEDVTPQTVIFPTTQSTPTKIVSCNRDSTWKRTHPNIPKSSFLLYETCTTITITYGITGQKITLTKPNPGATIENYTSLTAFNASTDSKKYYYSIRSTLPPYKTIIYELNEAGSMGVGGSGIKF